MYRISADTYLVDRRNQGCARACSALIRSMGSTTSSLEMKSLASEGTCWNNTSGMSYSPHTIFARTCHDSPCNVMVSYGYRNQHYAEYIHINGENDVIRIWHSILFEITVESKRTKTGRTKKGPQITNLDKKGEGTTVFTVLFLYHANESMLKSINQIPSLLTILT